MSDILSPRKHLLDESLDSDLERPDIGLRIVRDNMEER
jgi:hypothetical protein